MHDVIRHSVAVMPDVHTSHGATVGTVIPTTCVIVPASVGVDVGCGVIAARTSLKQEDLPASLASLRLAIEISVPHGRTHSGRSGLDAGSWRNKVSKHIAAIWRAQLQDGFEEICGMQRHIESSNHMEHLGTLDSGNHFIEVCAEDGGVCMEGDGCHSVRRPPTNEARCSNVWVMLHSGSRGVGNRIGMIFIELAKRDMGKHITRLPNADLAYLQEGTEHFDQYVKAVYWAQHYARLNREIMLDSVLQALRNCVGKSFTVVGKAINCHHNYVEHMSISPGEDVWLTRKGQHPHVVESLQLFLGVWGQGAILCGGRATR
uniref:3'-phosphate/5'-hydroxy nucleic acid ligase n=1 Tax=Trypanosoma congolense (strain IL3000) TaxID=1068625 RepID=G0UXP8_TRYCI|nr:unnamed protein product [Trypanosoma congolense IL3000]